MKFSRYTKEEAFAAGKSLLAGLLFLEQIFPDQDLHQLITVDTADHAAGIVVIGDVGRIFREQITYDLVDGIVAFLGKGLIHTPEDLAHILIIIGYYKFQGVFFRHGLSLLKKDMVIITEKINCVKYFKGKNLLIFAISYFF